MREIIGHKSIIELINIRKQTDSFSHAALITGVDGIGKSIIATKMASAILNRDVEECADLIKYYPKSKSFGVSNVRSVLEETNKKPYEGDRKVIILYKCELMTVEAQNALLKTIEEPPYGIFLILLTDSLESILDTIKSRCEIYKLTPLSKSDIQEYINIMYKETEISEKKAAIAYSMGVPGKVDRFLNDNNLKILRDFTIDMFYDIIQKKNDFAVVYTKKIEELNDKKMELLDIVLSFSRDIIFCKEVNDDDLLINSDKFDSIKDISRKISLKKMNGILKSIEQARDNFKNNTNYLVTLNVLFIKFAEV
ncbi:DNA polymerase III subunit delta' [Clostridium sp. BJN0001]|uniref:DNA polymerase III subunit delta' n=1 Tax=Clostridium sp. BJN0001 TaxID=2930219 RepID=UPI001FD61F2A|nr:DNA polymerase III subunit delta' [Clostridium sp. BJN0001]